MTSRNQKPQEQCEREVTHGDMNCAQARAIYGPEVVDTITRELRREGRNRACITPREHERLAEWKATGDHRVNGIVKNIVERSLGILRDVAGLDEPLQGGDALRVERLVRATRGPDFGGSCSGGVRRRQDRRQPSRRRHVRRA